MARSASRRTGRCGPQQTQQARGRGHLGAKQPHLEHRRALGRALDGQIAGAAQAIHGRFHQRGFHFQQLGRLLHQQAARQKYMAQPARLVERVVHARLHAHIRIARNAQRRGQTIRREKADAPHVGGQAEGILAHTRDGGRAVAFVNAGGKGGRNAVTLQKDHDLAQTTLPSPGLLNGLGARRADTWHLADPFRLRVQNLQGADAETLDDAAGEFWPNALDQPRAQVAANPGQRLGRELGVALHAKLTAKTRVAFVVAAQAQTRARGQAQQGAHHGGGLGDALTREARHRELTAASREHDALDGAFQNLFLRVAGSLASGSVEEIHAISARRCSRTDRTRRGR
jgi:hypothetical protein